MPQVYAYNQLKRRGFPLPMGITERDANCQDILKIVHSCASG